MRLFLAIFMPLSLVVVFLLRTVLVWRRTGINPVAFERKDDAHGYIGRVFAVVELAVFTIAALFVFDVHHILTPLWPSWLHVSQLTGAVLLVVSTVWAAIAQAQMGDSWRIGIDRTNDTSLVTRGLFRVTRNPIFLGLQAGLIGFLLAVPTAVTLAVVAVGHVLINVQVRLEESFLEAKHGAAYLAYRSDVRRWI